MRTVGDRDSRLVDSIAPTPLEWVDVGLDGRTHPLGLKLESHNPTGSIKHRTARALVVLMDSVAPLRPGQMLVESTSGNLGIGLARELASYDCKFTAVVDSRSSSETREMLRSAGVEVDLVDGAGEEKSYLLHRLRRVRQLLDDNPQYRWVNQYGSFANPLVHQLTTGPEITREVPDVDSVYVAVSTGGTLAGISTHLRAHTPRTRVIAVDGPASIVTGPAVGPSQLGGIGAGRHSAFLSPYSYDEAARVGDAEAVAMCRLIRQDIGLGLGGSSGSAVFAFIRDLVKDHATATPVCVCPDGADKYGSTIYSDEWLDQSGLLPEVERVTSAWLGRGLTFSKGHH